MDELVAKVTIYAAPVLAWLVVEFRGLNSSTDGNPAYTEVIRYAFKRWPWTKAAVLAGWTWVFFHFFVPQVPFA